MSEGLPASITGDCVLCGRASRFRVVPASDGSLRESLACAACGCIARQRAAASLLLDGLPRASRVYLTEQASVLYFALRKHLPNLRGSEWISSPLLRLRLSAWLWRQGVGEWIRREDVTALRFGDASLEAIATLDVLEHVPDYRRALREFARVLVPGGRLVLSVPYFAELEGVETRARVEPDGSITHLLPPEYHGDPLGGGVLCFHHFGRGLLDALREAGFDGVAPVTVLDPAAGLPQALTIIVAARSRNRHPPAPPGR